MHKIIRKLSYMLRNNISPPLECFPVDHQHHLAFVDPPSYNNMWWYKILASIYRASTRAVRALAADGEDGARQGRRPRRRPGSRNPFGDVDRGRDPRPSGLGGHVLGLSSGRL
uniref:Uncharacterized protein n=1 Tax=Ananas comosus var. bracteatus TaxID=296719 RepID=A0A6V7P0Q4_ANACO|nr:unnamed protein product [Ananas comosus var. bracteatus]